MTEFLSVFGIEDPLADGGEFEHKCPKEFGDDGYIDYFLPKLHHWQSADDAAPQHVPRQMPQNG